MCVKVWGSERMRVQACICESMCMRVRCVSLCVRVYECEGVWLNVDVHVRVWGLSVQLSVGMYMSMRL